MSKYIRGPWENDGHGMIWAREVSKGPMHIADIRGWGYLTGRGHGALGLSHEIAAEIQDSNAALIAAAPDLLERVKEMTASLHGEFCSGKVGSEGCSCGDDLALIAKAEGKK